jgi:RNA polymerase sigma factor (sigma-70 family)
MVHTDDDILKRLKENDGDAFSVIMEKYYKDLYLYGQHFTRDQTIVTDCIQDVFTNLWQNRHKADSIVFLRPYLLTSLKRRIIRVGSQRRKKVDMDAEGFRDYTFFLEFSVEDIIEEKQLAAEKAAKLRNILSQLPDRQKEVIYLVYYQQLDHSQVAQLMNINRQSVYNLLSESIRKLKEFWRDAQPVAPNFTKS